MKRGDRVVVVRYGRRGRPAAGVAPTVLQGVVIKAVSGVVWVDVGGETVRAWREQVKRADDDQRATELPSGLLARVDEAV
jgi:hypothetical protein